MQIKERILSLLKVNGPSLPVHIAKGTGLSILFASAFLSELFYEKKISISKIKVGNSPLYFIPGQEPQLERFSEYLKSREKESYLLLKEKKFLKDSEQTPVIRVALREIKDYAILFNKENEAYWRYFTEPEENLECIKNEILPEKEEEELEISGEKEPEEKKDEKKEKRKPAKKKNKSQEDNFFNKVKEFLAEKKIEIIDINNFSKNDLVLKIKENNREKLLIAYNKKKITEEDLIKAHKKASEKNLSYNVLCLGNLPKKIEDLISALKNLSEIERLDK